MMTTMRAIVLDAPGPPSALTLRDLPKPEPRPGWVLLRVEAFGLNRSELHTRLGLAGPDVTFPRVLGIEAAGVIEAAPGTTLPVGSKAVAMVGGMGRALDLILTGRSVGADEALRIGLVDRVVARGEARAAAEALAREIAGFPQACMRADRRSAYAQWELAMEEALRQEGRGGLQVLGEAIAGAARFAAGAGRHGAKLDDDA